MARSTDISRRGRLVQVAIASGLQIVVTVIATVLVFAAESAGQSGFEFEIVKVFDEASGFSPGAAVIQGSDGSLYGTTNLGGAFGAGTVFKVSPGGEVTTLHGFTGGLDGRNPGPLIQASDGNLYGTTGHGGTLDYGTIFRIDASGTLTTLHNFAFADGAEPVELIQATDGNFYGTAHNGGAFNHGVVYKLAPSGALGVLHSFTGGIDGTFPSRLIQATDGNFYGTTFYGGVFNHGSVFKVDSAGTLTTIHSFRISDGAQPYAGVIQGSNGDFFGTTIYGGAYSQSTGTVFRLDAGGTLTTLYSFSGGDDGAFPYGGVIESADGNLYGTTRDGGFSGFGTAFKLDVAGVMTTLHTFSGLADGAMPWAPLFEAADGSFYGTTIAGGASDPASDGGTLFRLVRSVPEPPRHVKGYSGDSEVSLQWQASAGADTYRVKRSTFKTGPYLQIVEVGGTSFIDGSVTNGVRYYYIITAVNAAGESEPSKRISEVPKALPDHRRENTQPR